MNSKINYPYAKRSFWDRFLEILSPGPDSKGEVFDILQQAKERQIIDEDGLAMMEGVLQVTELNVCDIMIPKLQMDMIDINDSLEMILPYVVAKAHSRFPVYDKDQDKVIGILLAKDLLKANLDKKFDWTQALRPAVCIPESKKLNVLLKEFRVKKNHIAIIIDEYSQVVGLVTIEDVIEQIIGDIEDEHDYDQDQDHILVTSDGWRVKGLTDIEQFNEQFNTSFSTEYSETVAGLITNYFGRIPHKGEVAIIDSMRFEVLRTDSRQVHLLKVRKALSDL